MPTSAPSARAALRWNEGAAACEPGPANDYADLLLKRLEKAHTLARDQLHVTAMRMSDWYDKKVRTQDFQVGDEVFVLNLRLYQGRCPKWLRRYSDVAVVTKKINSVTYVVHCNAWRIKDKIVHVEKLKLKYRPDMDDKP